MATFVAYVACFSSVALVLRRIDLSVAYAIWAGVGTAVAALLGIAVFGGSVTPLKVVASCSSYWASSPSRSAA